MNRLFITILLCCICSIAGICGINKTLNEAQSLFQSASSIAQYETAKKKFKSAKYDVGYVAAEHDNAINEGIRKCDNKINELSPRLTVNGNSFSSSISFDASGGSRTLTISTNQGTPGASALPSWLTVTSSSSTSMTISCSANTSTTSRSDWFNINAGSKTVRVDVSQSGKTSSSSSSSSSNSSSSQNTPNGSHSANIEQVWIEKDVTQDGKLGLNVHVKFTIAGMNGKDGRTVAYFYDSSLNAIKDTNGSYCTTDNNVSSGANIKPGYDNSRYDDWKIFIPYSELHQSGTHTRDLYVDVLIWDKSSSDNKTLARKDNTLFSFTPKVDSYLTVDNKTTVSASFPSSGGTETFYISTDADSWSTWGVPTFCEVTARTATSFTLKCNPNSGSERSDYMKVKTGNHEVRINIKQASKPGPTARIENVWVDHNVWNGMIKGMNIHIKLNVSGYKGQTVKYCVFFYQSNNSTKLVDMFGNHISSSSSSTSDYDSCTWNDWQIFVPYAQVFGAANATGKYSFDVEIQTIGGTLLVRNENNQFYQY